jgi:uncharacterized protein involved in type VI secretion and phage assembly
MGSEADELLTGVAVGQVTDTDDPENRRRVRVRLSGRKSGDAESWARTVKPVIGTSNGRYVAPAIGDEVLVAAEHGDPSRLYILGVL